MHGAPNQRPLCKETDLKSGCLSSVWARFIRHIYSSALHVTYCAYIGTPLLHVEAALTIVRYQKKGELQQHYGPGWFIYGLVTTNWRDVWNTVFISNRVITKGC